MTLSVGSYYNYYRDYDPSTGRYLQSDPRGILLDFSDPQRRVATQVGLPIPPYGYVNGLNQLFGYTGQNPILISDPTGEGAVAGTICMAAGGIDSIASIADFGQTIAEFHSIQENIETLEEGCPEEERSNRYNNYLDALRAEKLKLVDQIVKERGPGIAVDGLVTIACFLAYSPLIPL